ncbi:porin family protein [Aquabacterium sp.]|uniref:porin family protein n=1 Tax=Aquabacterium sp. TaxID=1872578 RepID=UPI0019C4AD4E|nr:porin family protein [Aquabacterium sp.]MBC7702221.1 porin family protein [Aquabacterium sp.]
MNFPQRQLSPRVWCLVMLCVGSQVSHAGDVPDETPAKDGPFASNLEYSADAPASSDQGWKPRQMKHHVGLSIGSARLPCIEGMVCRRSARAITLYAGGEFSQRWGFELAYMRMSNLEHVGNAVRVRGLNVNLLGELPLGSRLSLTGRLGANYARTRMDLATNPAVPTGSAQGFGLSYGVGVNWDVSESWSASTDLNRHDFKFVTGRDNVDTATVSLRFHY